MCPQLSSRPPQVYMAFLILFGGLGLGLRCKNAINVQGGAGREFCGAFSELLTLHIISFKRHPKTRMKSASMPPRPQALKLQTLEILSEDLLQAPSRWQPRLIGGRVQKAIPLPSTPFALQSVVKLQVQVSFHPYLGAV